MRIFIVNALPLTGVAVSLAAVLAACGGHDVAPACLGNEACPCYPNETCNTGLTCSSNVCVPTGGAGGGRNDSGADVSAGGASDGSGGARPDAGPTGAGGAGGTINTLGVGGAFVFPDAALPRSEQVDLLFMIDNSSSMADKQGILAAVVSDLVNRFINPACIDPTTGMVLGQRLATGACATGVLDFAPVTDMHIGIISSSLGSHGATNGIGQEICPAPDVTKTNAHNKDMAHLLNRTLSNGVEGTAPAAARGFLSWNGTGSADDVVAPFQSMVTGVGQHGCGYESQLEAIYRFLSDPQPYATIVLQGKSDANPGAALPLDVDVTLLQQRRDFLRPNSVVAVIAITDENDCSIDDDDPQGFFALLPPVSAQQGQISQLRRGTSACDTNPNDPCCINCGVAVPPPGCASPAVDPACMFNGGLLLRSQDPENLRCFHQKGRYGKDFLYPVDRYVAGFVRPTVQGRDGNPVPNPLYSDLNCVGGVDASGSPCTPAPPRDPRQVFFAGIVGVPWQDIAVDPNDLTKGYKTAAQLNSENVWATILGDPANPSGPILPTDSHMIESITPRPGLPGIDSAALADPINGHEWDITMSGPPNADLQYACIFDLPQPTQCDPMNPDCDCNDGTGNQGGTVADMKNPLCQSTNAYGHTQFRAKAYPGIRELQVLRGLGDQGIVASICPANTSNVGRPDFGYRPAIGAIVQRLRPPLQIR